MRANQPPPVLPRCSGRTDVLVNALLLKHALHDLVVLHELVGRLGVPPHLQLVVAVVAELVAEGASSSQ